ncbi:MAG: MBL fold metallo-hydrolase [Candidatus Aminicenantes bacterium]|nr:MAG: MBL fold metallo-hydrolase [Candidatus Aminicenantes bacterium]
MVKKITNGLSILLILSVLSVSQEYNPSEEMLKVIKLTDKIYKLQCISGTYTNLLASVGEDGILLVDTGYQQTGDILKQEIKKLGNGQVKIVVNTHEHNDHVLGNKKFADEAVIISHERVRKAYSGEYFALNAISRPGIPQVVFKDELTIFFNGEEVKLRHYPGGHSLGDVAVYFTKSKIVFVGDMVFAGCFPTADISRGGDLKLCLKNVQKIIDDYPEDSAFINGHGPDYSTEDLKKYLEVGITTQKMIEDEIEKGKTIKEILRSDLLADWKKWGEGVVSNEEWINCVYQQYLKENNKSRVSISKPLTEAITRSDIKEVVKLYKQLRQNEPDKYNFAENQLNILGYQLLARNMVKGAIEIFKLNVEAYPESGNVYDSLAEAYMNDGNRELAIKFYLKSLEKDPSNDNARGMLKRLGYKKE